jgi:glycosyltransferase involved in cell wall biosynthesis
MNDTAIIIGTYNRAHLLRRSLAHYPSDVDIFIMDDGSTDETKWLCEMWRSTQHNRPIYYHYLGDKKGWRDSAAYLNEGIKCALHYGYKYIFITHPEIIPGKTTIESAKELATNKEIWISCKGYYLTPDQQELLTDELNVKSLPGFYGQTIGNPNFFPENIEKVDTWHSWIFGGGSREMWQYFGGLTPFEVWGSIDIDLYNRRMIAGMKTISPNKESDYVIHQNHDDPRYNIQTPRDMNKCHSSLPIYKKKSDVLKPELLQ